MCCTFVTDLKVGCRNYKNKHKSIGAQQSLKLTDTTFSVPRTRKTGNHSDLSKNCLFRSSAPFAEDEYFQM